VEHALKQVDQSQGFGTAPSRYSGFQGPRLSGPDSTERPLITDLEQVAALLQSQRPVAFNVNFARITGDVRATLLLSQMVYWTRRGVDVVANAGWIFKTRDQWHAEIGLGRRDLESARNILVDKGLIQEARVGSPAKNCYRIVLKELSAQLASLHRAEPVQWSLLDVRSDAEQIKAMLGHQFAFHRVLVNCVPSVAAAVYLRAPWAFSAHLPNAHLS